MTAIDSQDMSPRISFGNPSIPLHTDDLSPDLHECFIDFARLGIFQRMSKKIIAFQKSHKINVPFLLSKIEVSHICLDNEIMSKWMFCVSAG